MNDNIIIENIALHYVGNRSAEEGVRASSQPLHLSESVVPFLKYFFLSPFKMEALCHFFHEAELQMNEMYLQTERIFEDHSKFVSVSAEIASFLYERSNHPKIKGGDFFVVLFKNLEVDHQFVEAIGLFKIENTENFIRISRNDEGASVFSENGISIKKLDKGCLILNTEKEMGYVVAVVDKTSRGSEAKYWIDDFLHVIPRNDGYNQTKRAVSLCKSYVKSLAGNVDKSQRAIMLNRMTELLREPDFDLKEMVNKVFDDEKMAQEFLKYNQNSMDDGTGIADNFKTEPSALKKLSFGNLTNIRLDNNFGISIRGGENLLEKGYDEEKGMKYYKLYFKEEK